MTDEKSNKALLDRYELLKGAEQHKNALIEVRRTFDFPPRSVPLLVTWRELASPAESTDIMKFLISNIPTDKRCDFQELLHRLNTVTLQYQREHLDLERESQYNRDGQMREFQLKEELRRTKAVLVRDPATVPVFLVNTVLVGLGPMFLLGHEMSSSYS